MKRRLLPGVKGVRIGNRLVALTDAQARDLIEKADKAAKKLEKKR